MKRNNGGKNDGWWLFGAIVLVLAVGLGVYVGVKITTARKDVELMDLQAALETANASLADANIEFEQNRVLAHIWTGVASWYGDQFHGRVTSSGHVFDMNDLTGASLTLPLGSMVIVENIKTGRMVPVLINDRGPYISGRGLDVSKAVAERLGILQQGLAKVRIYELIRGQPNAGD